MPLETRILSAFPEVLDGKRATETPQLYPEPITLNELKRVGEAVVPLYPPDLRLNAKATADEQFHNSIRRSRSDRASTYSSNISSVNCYALATT